MFQDLWDIRISKLRSSIDTFIKSHARTAKLDHLTQLEINSVRPLLPDALNIINDLQVGFKMLQSNRITVKNPVQNCNAFLD